MSGFILHLHAFFLQLRLDASKKQPLQIYCNS
jgi:hypothetical protein